jgi:hypothetical protein
MNEASGTAGVNPRAWVNGPDPETAYGYACPFDGRGDDHYRSFSQAKEAAYRHRASWHPELAEAPRTCDTGGHEGLVAVESVESFGEVYDQCAECAASWKRAEAAAKRRRQQQRDASFRAYGQQVAQWNRR